MTRCRHTGCPYDAVHDAPDCVRHFGTVPRHDPGNQFHYRGRYDRKFPLGLIETAPDQPVPARAYTVAEPVSFDEPPAKGFLARAIERLFG